MQKRILIAEDEATIAQALVRRLRARGYDPVAADSPERALTTFEEGRPDLVIASLTLPRDGGARLCRDIRSRPLGALVPILFLGTGREAIDSVSEAIAAGADHYFKKPDGIGDLLGKVGTYIGPGEDVPAPREDERGPVTTAEWAELDALLHAPAGDSGERELRPEPPATPPRDRFGWDAGERAAPPPEPPRPPAAPPVPARPRDFRPPERPAPDPSAEHELMLDPGRPMELGRRGIGELFAAAWRAALTGRVEVASAGVLRRVFFEDGRPVYADSSAPAEDLAAHLADEGHVARQALTRARARADQVGASPEEILIEAGFVDPDEVYRALRDHVLARVLALFALERGEAVVIRGGPRPLDPVEVGLHPARIVLDGIRRKYGRLRLYRAFGTAGSVPRPAAVELPEDLAMRPDEAAVRAACDGHRSVLEVARAARVGEVDALAILYGLSILGAVEAPGGRRAGLLPALDPEAVARAGAPRTADQMPGFADLVQSKITEALGADYFAVLGVEHNASTAELRAAFEALRRRFDPHRVRRDGPLWHQVVEIAAVVDDAWAILSEPRLRARYETALR
ncbi:MAG: response regulator [bacterium]